MPEQPESLLVTSMITRIFLQRFPHNIRKKYTKRLKREKKSYNSRENSPLQSELNLSACSGRHDRDRLRSANSGRVPDERELFFNPI
jgi:hypothetical protein